MKKDDIKYERMMIFDMINASIESAARKGKHPLTNGCICIDCVKKRKNKIFNRKKEWKFSL